MKRTCGSLASTLELLQIAVPLSNDLILDAQRVVKPNPYPAVPSVDFSVMPLVTLDTSTVLDDYLIGPTHG